MGADDDPLTSPTAGRAEGVRWDTGAMRTLVSNIASASAVDGGVVLNFGSKHDSADISGATTLELLGRIRLEPRTAKNLHDVLARLVADALAQAKRPR